MQKLIVIGNLVNDPELSETSSGIARCTFSVAVNRTYTRNNGERGCDYFNAIAWRGVGANIAKYCTKGSKIYLEGRLEQRSYEDNNGIKRTTYDYLVDTAEFLPNGKRGEDIAIEAESAPREESSAKRHRPTLLETDDDADIPF